MNDFFSSLKAKLGPLPVWAWAGIGTIILAVFLMRKNAKANAQTQAAADQTNSNLGSAAELVNMFEVAGLMPYQGGDVYVNTTVTSPSTPPGSAPTSKPPTNGPGAKVPPPPKVTPVSHHPTGNVKPRAIYTVKRGDNLSAIARKYGTTADTLFKYNTTNGVRPSSTIATLKQRGKNLLYANEKIYIPPVGWS